MCDQTSVGQRWGRPVPRLAIAIGETARLGIGDADLPVDARTGEAVLRARRNPVLLYRPEPAFNIFVATGRVTAVDFGSDGAPRLCRLGQLETFRLPVVSDREAALPRRQRHLLLPDDRFAELLDEAGGAAQPAIEEAAETFELDKMEIYQRIYAEVMRRWNNSCPFTTEGSGAADRPELVAIRAREAGGALHVDNYLPMTRDIAEAWTRGALTLGPDLAFWVDKSTIDPELEGKLRPIGRLRESEPGAGTPDAASLAFHRQHVFGRR